MRQRWWWFVFAALIISIIAGGAVFISRQWGGGKAIEIDRATPGAWVLRIPSGIIGR